GRSNPMKRNPCGSRYLAALALCVTWAAPGGGAILCKTKYGVVVVRDMCKKKETPLDPAALGLRGPQGDTGPQGPQGLPGIGPLAQCPPDAVLVGTACVDKYEASVWQIAPSNTGLVNLVQKGRATVANLTAGGATQLSPSPSCNPGFPAAFPINGQWTPVLGSDPPSPGIYAVSVAGVPPTACITWFQAATACAL